MIFLTVKILMLFCLVVILSGCIHAAEKRVCVQISNGVYKREISFGRKMRLVYGRFKTGDKRFHQWAEYWNKGREEWSVWDEAIWYIGKSWYTAKELGYRTYNVLETS